MPKPAAALFVKSCQRFALKVPGRSVDKKGMDITNGNGAVFVSPPARCAYSAVKITRRADGTFTVRVINADTVGK